MSTRIFYAPIAQDAPAALIIPGVPFALTMRKCTEENLKLCPMTDIIWFLKEHGKHFSDNNYDIADMDWVSGKSQFTLTTNLQNMTVRILHADRDILGEEQYQVLEDYTLTLPISGDDFCKQLLMDLRLTFKQLMDTWYHDDKEAQERINKLLTEAEEIYAATT